MVAIMPAKKTVKKTVEKNIVDEGVEKVMGFATKENAEGIWERFLWSFKNRDAQDYVFFLIGIILLIWSLRELWEFVWGVILLLGAILLFNIFFNKK